MTKQAEAGGISPTILVVEDSPVEAELLRRTLARAGYTVRMAQNGEEGLQAARLQRPTLVMSDIKMPVMDGYQLCRLIKYDDELWNIPVILLTVLSEPEDIIEAINCGADAYITKPYSETTLLNRIHSLLEMPVLIRRSNERREQEVEYGGKRFTIVGGGLQTLNLLLSLYENSLQQNRELLSSQTQLGLMNESLDQQVRERTAAVTRISRTLRMLSTGNHGLVRAKSEQELLDSSVRNIVENGGYLMASISYAGNEPEKIFTLVAATGAGKDFYPMQMPLSWADTREGQLPIAKALRSGEVQVCHDIDGDPDFAPWKAAALARGYFANLCLPLASGGAIFGILSVFSSDAYAFNDEVVMLLEEMAGDIAYGIANLRTQASLHAAELELIESEDKFKYLFEQSPIGKSITSPSGEIQVNHAFCEMLGYSERELQHRRWQEITHPDDIELSQRVIAQLQSGEQAYAHLIKRYLHKNGAVVWADVNTSLRRDEKGNPLYFMTSVMDITERKRAEDELRAASVYARNLIEASLDPLVTINPAGKITDVNEATIQATGVSREKLVGSDFSNYFTEPDKARAGYQEVFAKGMVTDYPLSLRNVSGQVKQVLYNASVYRNDIGEVTGVFAAARDITARKQAEEELHQYHEHLEELVRERTGQLEDANQELESFAYSVSHDLRTPLRAIDGFSQQVLKHYADKLDDQGKRYLNVVRDNTRKMSQLIDDILAFSRMGRLEIAMAEVGMEALAREVFEELRPGFVGRDVSMEIKPLSPCRGDLAMLRQVWVNLLGNALKFTKYRTAAQIEVGGHTEGTENIYYVRDNGAGYDMQYADKLFGVFQRLHGNEEFEGTGIGLAIVKRIVTRHGGRVWAEGKVAEGATFYFALPLGHDAQQS